MKLDVLTEPVLVGREKELEELQALLTSVVKGRGKTVFVSGEAGAGKTRLITDFLQQARKRGIVTLTGWCLSNSAVPYFPFFEAFGHYVIGEQFEAEGESGISRADELQHGAEKPTQVGSPGSDLAAWLLGSVQIVRGQPISPQVWKDQTFAAVATTLSSIASNHPVVMFIDDVHWADSASLALIHYISRSVVSEKVLLIASYRSEALTVDTEGKPCLLVETLRLMKREDLLDEIKLSPLSKDGVFDLAKNMLGSDLQPRFADKLSIKSQGNPLFVVESLRMLHEHDSLVQELDKWRLTHEELGIPDKIKDIILQRLSCLTRKQRKVLDAASIIGERFDAQILASAFGLELVEVLETLDAIAQSTSLVCCEGELFKFDHARSRDAVYGEITPTLKKIYHAKVAEKIEGVKKPGDLLATDLAYHFAMAGNKEKALKYALAAGQDALARWSNEEAIKHFMYVLQNTSENAQDAETRRKAEEGLGDAYYANNMFKDATRTFEDLSSRQTGADKLRALRKAMESTFCLANYSQLMELVRMAEPLVTTSRLERARVLVQRGRAYLFGQANLKLALEDFHAALDVFEEEYSLWDTALALLGVSSETSAGLRQKGIAAGLRSIALFQELGDFRFQMEAIWPTGTYFLTCGLFDEALRFFDKVVEINERTKMGDFRKMGNANAISLAIYLFRGDWKEALSRATKGLEFSKMTDTLDASAFAYSNLCIIYTRLGEIKLAEQFFKKLVDLPDEAQSSPLFIAQGLATKAVFLAGKGEWEESNQFFEQTLERSKTSPNPTAMLAAKVNYAWALEKQGRSADAKALTDEIQNIVLERQKEFAHVDLQADLMVLRKVWADQEFEMRFDLVNVSSRLGTLLRIEAAIPSGFNVTNAPPYVTLQNGTLVMKDKEVGPFQVETIRLELKADTVGNHSLSPEVFYVDDLGETRTVKLNPITITVELGEPTYETSSKRITTGTTELDTLLQGGISEKCAVVLAAPSSDERSKIIENFVEAGPKNGETTFYFTVDPGNTKHTAEEFPSDMLLFVCNQKADLMVKDLSNVCRLKGVDSLTDIDIALVKASRQLESPQTGKRRACIEVVSNVLLQHGPVITVKWLNSLLQDLKSKGFATLAVVNPRMHSAEELEAILGVFDGEIRLGEKQTAEGTVKTLKVLRLQGQDYLKNEATLG